MKFKNSGRIFLAFAVSLGLGFGLTSCANDYTVAYLYVTGAYQSQIGAFGISNNTGNLHNIPGSPFGSGGADPVRVIVAPSGRYIYVLNAGTTTTDPTTGNISYKSANISVFSVGGNGTLAFQQSYTSQGFGAKRFAFNPSGTFLYVLDEYSPAAGTDSAGNPLLASKTLQPGLSCLDSAGMYHPVGDVTAFIVDTNTGRLSLITNSQVQNANGTQLPYFPVGCEPVDFKVTGAFVLSADTSDPTNGNRNTVFSYAMNLSTGQLTTTQNGEFVTGAAGMSAIGSDAGGKYIYILDPVSNQIWYYTIGTDGVLQAVTGSPASNARSVSGNPVALTTDSKDQFLYVANAGPTGALGQANSDITYFNIASNGVLTAGQKSEFGTGSGPQCIIEDPSNQYLYTADYNSNTVTGKVLDPASGTLTDLRNQTTYSTVGNPTWCVADGHTD